MDLDDLRNHFQSIYKTEAIVIQSPGRVNIIGEHTDYNGGYVMPAAINKGIYVAISKRDDEEIHLFSKVYNQHDYSNTTGIKKSPNAWANYILGVADQIQKQVAKIGGFNLYIDGDIPLGAGLSSSAAVECATAFALDHLFKLDISKMNMALISQKAEQVFSGVNCGIMDQFASVFGQKDHAIVLDCRSMDYEYIPLKLDGYKLVLLNTNIKHKLSDSAYNQRRAKCEQGVLWLNADKPDVQSLRDANLEMLDRVVKPRDVDVYTKCRYVVEENDRVLLAIKCMKNGDLKGLGELMYQTHKGLSEAYEVSCSELDFLVNYVKNNTSVLGARMMGGGFGGCTINIVKEEKIDELVENVRRDYAEKFGIELSAYIVETGNGTAIIA